MTSKINLCALQFETTDNFQDNLNTLISLIDNVAKDSFILAPELCLNGYAYDRLTDAVNITNIAIRKLKDLSKNKTIALTMTTQKDDKFYNTLFIFNNEQIVHTQSKNKLFVLNDERVYFTNGDENDMQIINIGNLKVATLICFELRFIDFWKKFQGADIILVPSMWGKLRKQNYETLTKAIAVMNQCFVIASDSANKDMAKSSGIITPFGDEYRDDSKSILIKKVDLSEIKKMRRYMNIGI